jgi:hypothetical protein
MSNISNIQAPGAQAFPVTRPRQGHSVELSGLGSPGIPQGGLAGHHRQPRPDARDLRLTAMRLTYEVATRFPLAGPDAALVNAARTKTDTLGVGKPRSRSGYSLCCAQRSASTSRQASHFSWMLDASQLPTTRHSDPGVRPQSVCPVGGSTACVGPSGTTEPRGLMMRAPRRSGLRRRTRSEIAW